MELLDQKHALKNLKAMYKLSMSIYSLPTIYESVKVLFSCALKYLHVPTKDKPIERHNLKWSLDSILDFTTLLFSLSNWSLHKPWKLAIISSNISWAKWGISVNEEAMEREIIRIPDANFLYFCIQSCWFPLAQIKCVRSRRLYIKKKKKCKNFLLEHSRMYFISQRNLYYIASTQFPKLSFVAVNLRLGTHIELEVN